jgi:hypothetical protein
MLLQNTGNLVENHMNMIILCQYSTVLGLARRRSSRAWPPAACSRLAMIAAAPRVVDWQPPAGECSSRSSGQAPNERYTHTVAPRPATFSSASAPAAEAGAAGPGESE